VEIQEPEAQAQVPAGSPLGGSHRFGALAEVEPVPGSEGPPRRPRRRLRVFPYAVSRAKLERAIRQLGAPALIVGQPGEADVLLTLKSQQRRQPRRLLEAEQRGLRLAVVKSNTVAQLESFLRAELGIEAVAQENLPALREVEDAIDQVLGRGHPVELSPQDPAVRRLQHEAIGAAGLTSQSRGLHPFRRVVVYPS